MVKIIGKNAGQIMNLIENYVFKERERDKDNKLVLKDRECTLQWNERENCLYVTYTDGTAERYDNNMRIGPQMFIAVRRKTKESKLAQKTQDSQ